MGEEELLTCCRGANSAILHHTTVSHKSSKILLVDLQCLKHIYLNPESEQLWPYKVSTRQQKKVKLKINILILKYSISSLFVGCTLVHLSTEPQLRAGSLRDIKCHVNIYV